MSARPTAEKHRRKVAKMFRMTPERTIDLVEWLMDRRYAQTAGDARRLIQMGAVRHESHKLGVDEIYQMPANDKLMSHLRLAGNPRVPFHVRKHLQVIIPEEAFE